MCSRSLFCALAFLVLSPGTGSPADRLRAQTPEPQGDEGWNSERVRALVERAREARRLPVVDSALLDYRAEARGYVYFFIDRPANAEHVLVKADQVALDLYWRAPEQTKQRIVGQRAEKVLPTDIRYHLDHLTVVQDDYGDFIRLGDGDEVAQVVHPIGPGSTSAYDFQLVDSLSLAYGSGQEIRVYQVRVRPKDFERPGFVGTVFLDRDNAAIVRMNFSFTPASYVDPYLDYIRISLDNSLWMGRFWLPYRQETELRREMPLLDFSAGSVIRTRFAIGGYAFNSDLPDAAFDGGRVSALPLSQRRAFPFERGLFEEIEAEGLTISPTMEEVRTQVREVVEDEVMTGLSPIRLHLDGISDFARYNRAEGAFVGAGLTLRPYGDFSVRPSGGYAFGRAEPSGALTVTHHGARLVPTVSAYWDRMGDIGGNPGASPLVNTISSASGSKDFLDPYFRRGATVAVASAPSGPTRVSVGLRWERHEGASDVVSDGEDVEFRPVRSIDEGTLGAVDLGVEFMVPGDGRARLTGSGGRIAERTLLTATADLDWQLGEPREGLHGRILAKGGLANPGAPAQAMYLLGGRHTLPGQDYRAFVGNAYGLMRAEGTLPVKPPYVGIRAFGVVGATHLGSVDLPADWSAASTEGLRGSIGVGLSVGWDTLFLDLAHGVRGGGWEAVFAVSERFEGWM